MSLRLYGTISGWGRSAGAVIPALGSGRYSPGPNIVLPSWLKGSDPNCTITVFWGQPGALATVSFFRQFLKSFDADFQRHILHKRAGARTGHPNIPGGENIPKDGLPTPDTGQKNTPTATPGPAPPPTFYFTGWDLAQAEKFLKELHCDPASERYATQLAGVWAGEKTTEGH